MRALSDLQEDESIDLRFSTRKKRKGAMRSITDRIFEINKVASLKRETWAKRSIEHGIFETNRAAPLERMREIVTALRDLSLEMIGQKVPFTIEVMRYL